MIIVGINLYIPEFYINLYLLTMLCYDVVIFLIIEIIGNLFSIQIKYTNGYGIYGIWDIRYEWIY